MDRTQDNQPLPGKGRRILLVEDDGIFASLEGRVLALDGYGSTWAASGEEALERIREAPFDWDMVLLDLELGAGMSGIETAEQILSVRSMPIVFVSGHTESDLFDATRKIPSYGFIVKHAGNSVLRNSVAMAFRLWESLQRQGEQDRQFRLVMENLPEVLLRLDADRTIRFCSPAMSRHFPLDTQVLAGRPVEDCGLPSDLATVLGDLSDRALASARPEESICLTGNRESPVQWEIRATPEREPDGTVRTCLLFMRDESDRREAAQFRHLTETRLSSLLALHNHSTEMDPRELLTASLRDAAASTGSTGGFAWHAGVDSSLPIIVAWPPSGQDDERVFMENILGRMDGNRLVQVDPDYLQTPDGPAHSLVCPVEEDDRTTMVMVLRGSPEGYGTSWASHIGLWAAETSRLLQKKLTRDALVLQIDHNRAILSATPDGFMVMDEMHRIQDVNEAWMRLFGYRKSEILGRDLTVMEAGIGADTIGSRLRSVRYKGTDHFECQMKNRNNEIMDIELSMGYSPVGRHYICLMRDIRSRKEHERKLLRMQGLLEETGRMSKTGAWDFDLAGSRFFWTDEVYRILDVTPEFDCNLDHVLPFIDPDDLTILAGVVKTAMEKQGEFTADVSVTTVKGRTKRVTIRGSSGLRAGAVKRLYGTVQDISRQYEIQEDLNRRDAEMKRFFDMSEDLLGIMDSRSNRFVRLSPGWARSLGYDTTELEGQRMTDLVHPDNVEDCFRNLALAREGKGVSFTTGYRCKDGTWRTIDWRVTPGAKALYIVARDVTEAHRLQQQRAFMEDQNHRLLDLYQRTFTSEEEIIDQGLKEAMALTGSRMACCHQVHDDQKHLDLFCWTRKPEGVCHIPVRPRVTVRQAGAWAGPLLLRKGMLLHGDPEFPREMPEGCDPCTHLMGIPVMEGTKVRMIAGVGRDGDPWTEDMVMQLELFMNGLWKIVQKFRADALAHHREDEKKDLWKEMNHRLDSTTGSIRDLLDLEEQHAHGAETKAVLRKTANRIGSMLRTFHNLSASSDGLAINLRAYLEETAHQSFLEHLDRRDDGQVMPAFSLHCPELMVNLQTAGALGLICGELVSNGLRHGFTPDSESPSLEMQVSRNGPREVLLTYRDNGRGFPRGKHPHTWRKLGLELLNRQVREAGGSLDWDITSGCSCTVSLPLPP